LRERCEALQKANLKRDGIKNFLMPLAMAAKAA
jgi:hypothetical protein